MNIDEETYRLFVEAIRDSLKERKPLTFSEIVQKIKSYFKKSKTEFPGSVDWYAVAVKNDMQVRGQLKVYTEKGKKLHMIGNSRQTKLK